MKAVTTAQAKSAVSSQQVKSTTTTSAEQAKSTTKHTGTATATAVQSTAIGINPATVFTAKTKGGKSETPKQLTAFKEQEENAGVRKTITVTKTTIFAKYKTTSAETARDATVEGTTKAKTSATKERSETVKQVRKVVYKLHI